MRALLIASFIAASATNAFAQNGGRAPPSTDDKAAKAAAQTQRERKENEAAAKDALSKIPDSKEKYDPWKIGK